jgi:cytochrome c556
MKSRLRLLVILSVMVASGVEAPAQTAATGRLMQAKLAHSQKILEAILTSDFALLEQESNALGQVTKSPAWSVFYNPEYTRQSGAFLRAIDDLRDAAKGADLDGAASSYVSLTLSCFQCHRYMKNRRIAMR